jgi:polar amino acid transport system substrate-binding protein
MRHPVSIIAIALCLFSAGLAVAAPLCNQPITFAVFEAGLLYDSRTNDGIDKAVMQELGRRSNCEFVFSLKPRARIWFELENGEIMMTGAALRSEERDKYSWAVNYFGLKADVMMRTDARVKSAEEFLKDEALRFGVVRGFIFDDAMGKFIEELRRKGRIEEVANGASMYPMLDAGRFSAMQVTPLGIAYSADYDRKKITMAKDWFPTDKSVPRALLFSRKYFSAEQVAEWRKLVQQMRADGTLKKIFRKYVGEAAAEKLLQFPSE